MLTNILKQIQKLSKQIKSYLEQGNTITAITALEKFKFFRLASRITDLKQSGVPIDSQFIEVESGKKVKEYWIAQ